MPTGAGIWLDIHEPAKLETLLGQVFAVERLSLNQLGYADILWHGVGGLEQLERKQAGEVLSNIPACEEQLRRELANESVSKTRLVVEGLIAPDLRGCVVYQMADHTKVMYKGRTFPKSYKDVMAWFSGLEENGVEVYQVPSIEATAILVAALHDRAQKSLDDRRTFSRYIKLKPTIKAYNPFVLTLMGVQHGGVGEEIGRALIAKFKTPIGVFEAVEDDIAATPLLNSRRTVGPAVARKLLTAIGRLPNKEAT